MSDSSKLYNVLCSFNIGTPCLSFDLINSPSHTISDLYFVSGSQSDDNSFVNKISLCKVSNICDNLSSAKLRYVSLLHNGSVNRIRHCYIDGHLWCASWSERGIVYMWDLENEMAALDDDAAYKNYVKCGELIKPAGVCGKHKTEGYAMSWSIEGVLVTGDNNGDAVITRRHDGGFVSDDSWRLHAGSVEDVAWRPKDAHVFISCSNDGSILLADIRTHQIIQSKKAHESDVNVVSWRPGNSNEILSGGDDGIAKLWDIRQCANTAKFDHHNGHPITSVCWNKTGNMFAVASEDDVVTQWDVSPSCTGPGALVFVHCGQKEIKEIMWSSVQDGIIVSTGRSGFNIFKTVVPYV